MLAENKNTRLKNLGIKLSPKGLAKRLGDMIHITQAGIDFKDLFLIKNLIIRDQRFSLINDIFSFVESGLEISLFHLPLNVFYNRNQSTSIPFIMKKNGQNNPSEEEHNLIQGMFIKTEMSKQQILKVVNTNRELKEIT